MQYHFMLLEEFFKSWQIEYINLLESCQLLGKFTPDCKKILIYLYLTNINKLLDKRGLLFYHTDSLSADLEIFQYIDYEKFNTFFNKITRKVRSLTGKVFIVKNNKLSFVPSMDNYDKLDGCIQDEILLLNNIKSDMKEFKKFLSEVNLKHIFNDMTRKCC